MESEGASASGHGHGSVGDLREAETASAAEVATLVEPSFDENVLRALCETDCGVQLLLDRIKQSTISCKEVAVFLKKRAALEDEYSKQLQKLARTSSADYSAASEAKGGSFVEAWQASMRIHDTMAEKRSSFAIRLNEMSEELQNLVKEVEKNRKATKDLSTRYERSLQESETMTEKAKARVEMTAEELERLLLQKEGESLKDNAMQTRSPVNGKRVIGKAVAKGGLLLKGKNPQNLQRQEDDVRARMSAASDTYRKVMIETQAIRQEYFNFQLPRILRSLKECVDEIDLGTQYHLSRYAFLTESIVHDEATTLQPPEDRGPRSLGLKATMESIDNRADFRTWMDLYVYAHAGQNSRAPRRNGPEEDGFLPPIAALQHQQHVAASSPGPALAHLPKARPTFGIDLTEQMARDDVDVPPILEKMCEAIEKYGLDQQGLYRIAGTHLKVNKLKDLLDRDLDAVNLDADEWRSEISNVTSALKAWLRELPDPVITQALYQDFIDAARNENERARHIRLHERVNALPDPNYSTLRYLMGHLHKVVQHSELNSMTVQNVAIVIGPSLFNSLNLQDTSLQNKAVETILEHYTDIFVDEAEE
ncbi:GTPase activating protein [Epithele typhae]|uniref:GTPase activating protein n=1 Tax=Epithele typhae TaxID=378194 RepID=UPI002007855B|nr:GTPase activating protein [Epithele typhae]KAH9926242.1 GTPase activating protein [Epithele typhae]